MRYLGEKKSVIQCLIEGGATLQGSFLRETNLIREVFLYIGATLLGSS